LSLDLNFWIISCNLQIQSSLKFQLRLRANAYSLTFHDVPLTTHNETNFFSLAYERAFGEIQAENQKSGGYREGIHINWSYVQESRLIERSGEKELTFQMANGPFKRIWDVPRSGIASPVDQLKPRSEVTVANRPLKFLSQSSWQSEKGNLDSVWSHAASKLH
jgi:hypothetical protein